MKMLFEVLLAFRPKTLTAAFVPCLAASFLAFRFGNTVDQGAFLCALMAAFFIQIGTNLVNDSVDFVKGADNSERIGPRRITAAGILSSRQVLMIASVCFAIAVAFGIPLALKGGAVIVSIGLISILMGYAYTAGPFPLAYLGLGDLFVILFFGMIAVGGMYFIHTGELSTQALWMGLQIGFHATVLIAINNLRDRQGDQKVGKRTLAVRFGEKFSKWEITALLILPFVMNLYWMNWKLMWATFLPIAALPLAIFLSFKVHKTSPGPIYNRFLGMSAAVHFVFGTLLAVGLWLG